MPIVGTTGTPTAADAVFPAAIFAGLQVADIAVATAYEPHIATALDLPYKLQNEIIAIETYLQSQAASSAQSQATQRAISYAVGNALFNWQTFH